MVSDQGPVVESALLRSELVRLRKEKGMTQEQVAEALEWSPSKLIRVEGGKNAITRTDLQALLMVYDVTSESRQERLQALARGARATAWWDAYKGEVSDVFLTFVGYASGASYIRQFHNAIVPGLLQTREYAEYFVTGRANEMVRARAVQLRLQRQEEMAKRENPPRQYYILDEAVIRRHVGIKTDPGIMPRQLTLIADQVEQRDDLTVRVIPFSAGAHLGVYGPFTLLEFDGGLGDVLYMEGMMGPSALMTGDNDRIADFRDDFETLLEEALPQEESIALMRQVAEELVG
ncbi:transcriptional regulator [Actinomadura sp. NBRC 104412]|uniref:helix-turn-helix domain-containing protein n=1 Tax=Actinomadura sp. NBRC 104412 TaxID=3032203 RepID=UPI0024A0F829|nr:helix-turn-helix transcriptional regulator [Actinomadura sp. NBRC 104412]GLZ08874.1 transcriptional regulator [Actinomadura sp. NBRC 104412]